MNTTSIFVELIVIGIGAAAWIITLILGFAGLSLGDIVGTFKTETAIPLLAVVYVLGIIIDRLADTSFDKIWGNSLRDKKFDTVGEYYNARRNILINSERLSELLEYGRSRLRICRGWCFNAAAMAISFNIYLLLAPETSFNKIAAGLTGTLLCAFLALGTWYAWKKLTQAEYRKVKEQSKYLDEKKAGE